MSDVPSLNSLMANLSAGNYTDAVYYSAQRYLPYSMFWIMLGFIICLTVFKASKDYSITGIVWIIYLATISLGNVIHPSMQPYMMAIIGVSIFVLLARVFLK